MAYQNTLSSLYKNLDVTGQLDDRFSRPVEKMLSYAASEDAVSGVLTINPNLASVFTISADTNVTLSLGNIISNYSSGSITITILLGVSDGVSVAWQSSSPILWPDGTAPELETLSANNTIINIITLTGIIDIDGEGGMWFGGSFTASMSSSS